MKVLILGCGSIGSRHARNVRALGIGQVILFDPELERSVKLAVEMGAIAAKSVEEAYSWNPDVALICAPTRLHLPLARQALAHNCHLFIEKPISDTTAGVPELISEAGGKQKVLFVGYMFRFDPVLRTLRDWLQDRRIGHVVSARIHFGSYLPWRHREEDYRLGYGARRELGGGVILDAIHELDLALWLFGWPNRVYATGGQFSDLEMDVEDTAEILLRYRNTAVSLHLDFLQRPPRRWCEFIGTEGQIHADFYARKIRIFSGAQRQWSECEINVDVDDLYRTEMEHFLNCIRGYATPLVNVQEAMRSLELAEAVKESIARHGVVNGEREPVSAIAGGMR